jgi:peptidoglycan-N-acetylmuramic acid deacetylase
MRKFISGLIAVCLTLSFAVMFTGCEPNVPENDNENGLDGNETLHGNNKTEEKPTDTEHGLNGEHTSENGLNPTNPTNPTDPTDGYGVNGENTGENGLDTNELPTDTELNPLSFQAWRGQNHALHLLTASTVHENDFTHLPNNKIGWGLGSEVDEKNRPLDAVRANQDYGSFGAAFIGEREPVIYLTFDEGYENGYTDEILDVLKSRKARATFFVTYDYCTKVPGLVQRMIDEGHTIGNHTTKHPSLPDLSVKEIGEEISTLHEHVKAAFNYEMNLIRPPMGEFSQRSLAVAQDLGYTSVFWSFAYMDWNVNNQPCSNESLAKVKNATHPGAIVLLHAVSSTNAQILGEVIDFWHSEGYRLGVIGENEVSEV